jgi:hypothetical protein
MTDGFHTKKILKEDEAEDLSIYSLSSKRKRRTTPKEAEPIKRLSSKTITVVINGKEITLPTVESVSALERENVELKQVIERLKIQIRQLASTKPSRQNKDESWF